MFPRCFFVRLLALTPFLVHTIAIKGNPVVTYREYLQEIENFTEQNLLDQVISHSSHILKSYPNSIDALRFLGQAFLEQKNYIEASNCFEKLLSFVPDDFVSHVGISSIKEEDRDIDAAIFHMEIAFDTQPSNVIVQEELKRLINKRDGTKPQKINLSRGALIRMYIKGDLYQQALNEIEATLLSYPERIDIQVLQAKVYAQSNAKVQAVEVCNRILELLPFCLEPNQILYRIFLENGLSDQANQVQERLISLNPYYKYVLSSSSQVEDIPDSKVEIPKLEYTSAFSTTNEEYWSPPADETSAELTPSSSLNEEHLSEFSGSQNNASELIPDFLTNAGWEKSENLQNASTDNFDNSSDLDSNSVANISELPDWLKNFKPGANFTNPETSTSNENQDPLSIINKVDTLDETSSNTNLLPVDNLSSISEVEMTADIPQPHPSQDDSSDWMSQFFDEANKQSSEPEDEKGLPDWLKTFGQDDALVESNSEDESPDWLKNLDSQIVENESKVSLENQNPVTPSNLDEIDTIIENKSPFSSESDVTPEKTIEPSEEKPTFLDTISADDDFINTIESLSTENLKVESTTSEFFEEKIDMTPISSDNSDGVLPDWVKSVLTEPEDKGSELQTTVEPFSANQSESINLTPNNLSSVNDPDEPISSPEGAISQDAGDELLEWLRGISPDQSEIVSGDELESKFAVETTSNSEIFEESLNRLEEISGNTPATNEETPKTSSDIEPSFSIEELQPVENILTENESNEFSDHKEALEVEDIQEVTVNQPSIENFRSLLLTARYPEASSLFAELNSSGLDPNEILDIIASYKTEKIKDFDFLQFFGDSLAAFDHFDEAMEIYTQAENILMGK